RHFGMMPTHVDSHMGTLFSEPRYFEGYTRVAKELGIVPMLMGPSPETNAQAKALGLDYPPLAERLRSQGYLLLDRLITGANPSGSAERKKKNSRPRTGPHGNRSPGGLKRPAGWNRCSPICGTMKRADPPRQVIRPLLVASVAGMVSRRPGEGVRRGRAGVA